MKKLQRIIFFWVPVILISCNTNNTAVFNEIEGLLEQDNYFKAKELFEINRNELSGPYRKYVEAVLYNAFNKLQSSEEIIEELMLRKRSIPDSLIFKLFETKYDNNVKQYKYREAKHTIVAILSEYNKYLNDEQTANYRNSHTIWTALENTPAQKADVKLTTLRMVKDKAGLNTLKVHANQDSLDFIFDTGANLSTTSVSVAKQSGMSLIPVDIKVGAITGTQVPAQLAVCDSLRMGNITLCNVVFLVMPDEALSFPQIDYQIYGILGYSVIEALKEIRISQKNGDFIISPEGSSFPFDPNMAMSQLTPLIYIDGRHYTFDTGADHTMLYHSFYREYQKEIDENYQLAKMSFGGAGGRMEFEGYTIDHTFNVSGKPVKLENISLLKEKIRESETVYGNIGQDLIKKFDTMIINFNGMFIRFE